MRGIETVKEHAVDVTVAASDASAENKRQAEYVCDGIVDNIEIQAAIDAVSAEGPVMFLHKFQGQDWFSKALTHWTSRFHPLEQRLFKISTAVAFDKANRDTFSNELVSILNEAGSIFDSVLRELAQGVGIKPRKGNKNLDIVEFCEFLRNEIPEVHMRSIAIRALFPGGLVVPFEPLGAPDGIPAWWTAYNKVKHQGSDEYGRGNLENALTACCALALVGFFMGASVSQPFVNPGIPYLKDSIDMSDERRLFPPRP